MDGKLSVQTDCFPSEAGRDSRISGARGAAPCTERSDAKQPGLPSSGLFASQSARIQGLPCIEVRPCYQGITVRLLLLVVYGRKIILANLGSLAAMHQGTETFSPFLQTIQQSNRLGFLLPFPCRMLYAEADRQP